jgi:hypothetical protein
MKKFTEFLLESSLSRVYKHSKEHDIGTITAFRDKHTKAENKQRNKSLKVKLLHMGYGVTAVKGTYIEKYNSPEAVEVSEDVFLVVDLKDSGRLVRDLKALGANFDQDSILYIKKGGTSGELIGTNADGYPGLNKKIVLKGALFGASGEFFTKVNGRPFTLKEEVVSNDAPAKGWHRNYAISKMSKQHWSEL